MSLSVCLSVCLSIYLSVSCFTEISSFLIVGGVFVNFVGYLLIIALIIQVSASLAAKRFFHI